MASYTTTTTFGSTGIKAITPGFQATSVSVSVTPATGLPSQLVQHCFGWTDGTRKMCDSIFMNPVTGNARSEKSTSKLVRLWDEDSNGNIIVILEAVLDSITATQVKFNVTTAHTDYQVSIKCEG